MYIGLFRILKPTERTMHFTSYHTLLTQKELVRALEELVRHYDELLVGRDNEIQMLRDELRRYQYPSFSDCGE